MLLWLLIMKDHCTWLWIGQLGSRYEAGNSDLCPRLKAASSATRRTHLAFWLLALAEVGTAGLSSQAPLMVGLDPFLLTNWTASQHPTSYLCPSIHQAPIKLLGPHGCGEFVVW